MKKKYKHKIFRENSSEDEWDLHLKSGHSADDQVLISSLLALASDPGPAVNLVPNNVQVNNASESNNVYLCGECSCEFFTDEECAQHVSVAHPKNSILRGLLCIAFFIQIFHFRKYKSIFDLYLQLNRKFGSGDQD